MQAGIGFESMRVLTNAGATVIGLARSKKRAQQACDQMNGKAIPVVCEHSDFESITRSIIEVRGLEMSLDAIILNAGIMTPKTPNARYGIESQFLINHLSHMYLVLGLEDIIQDNTGRIVVVSSSAHSNAPKKGVDFDNTSGDKKYSPLAFYAQSKIANIAFSNSMAKRLASRGIISNALHPGIITDTGLFDSTPKLVLWVLKRLRKTTPEGAATQCYLAVHPDISGQTGGYYSNCNIAKVSTPGDDDKFQEKLWDFSLKLINRNSSLLDNKNT